MMKHLVLVLSVIVSAWMATQAQIPTKPDGFWYENRAAGADSVVIEAFFDPVCSDSRDAWPPLKEALLYYASPSRVSLLLHPFPLPYHDNAFISSRALHVINSLNASATFDLLEAFFENQEAFYNQATLNESRASVLDQVVKFTAKSAENSLYPAIESGFSDSKTDQATRVSFKYGCLRGVYGTPFFFVNGFPLPDAGYAISYDDWRSVLDPLLPTTQAVESYK